MHIIVHASFPVYCGSVFLLDTLNELFGIYSVGIFDTKVTNNEAEYDGFVFMSEKDRYDFVVDSILLVDGE